MREGKTVAILSLGTRLAEAEKAADELEAKGLSTTVADLRFAKPLDSALIRRLMTTHEVVVTVEEAAIGGLGAHVLTLASDEGLIDAGLKLQPRTFEARVAQRSVMGPFGEANCHDQFRFHPGRVRGLPAAGSTSTTSRTGAGRPSRRPMCCGHTQEPRWRR